MDPTAPSPLLRSFERHLRAENRSDKTVATYLIAARQAEAFLAARGLGFTGAGRPDLEAFLGDLLARRAASTAVTYHKVLKVLYRWLEEEEEVAANPTAKLRPPIIPEQPVPVVPDDGLRRLLAACAGRRFEDRRDTALLMMLLCSTPAPAGPSWPACGWPTSTWTWTCWSSARAAASGRCRSATRPRSPWTLPAGPGPPRARPAPLAVAGAEGPAHRVGPGRLESRSWWQDGGCPGFDGMQRRGSGGSQRLQPTRDPSSAPSAAASSTASVAASSLNQARRYHGGGAGRAGPADGGVAAGACWPGSSHTEACGGAAQGPAGLLATPSRGLELPSRPPTPALQPPGRGSVRAAAARVTTAEAISPSAGSR
jgi:hypothetical protein